MDSLSQYLLDLEKSFVEVNYLKFALNMVITAGLSAALAWYYIHFGHSVSNRRRFARNFLPLAMTTMLIIFIVKSSFALSLGLVGALSIVRFRSAIKDPEELTYLFLTIGLGLAAGAEQIVIAVVAFVFILTLLTVQNLLRGGRAFRTADNMYLNLSTSRRDLPYITKMLGDIFSFIELKRIDESDRGLELSFVVNARSIEEIETARKKLSELGPDTIITFVEQRNIAV